jgi:hypothetical protein
VEPDPRRRAGGRGAYVCRRWECVVEAAKRARWARAFRAAASLGPGALERIRGLLQAGSDPMGPGEKRVERVVRTDPRVTERSVKPVEGGW